MIDRGWAIVATDYPGMGTAGRYPYLIGVGEGQATLDGLRALCQVDDAHASNRVMLWGHSQGGHATLWAAQIAADYAPDLDVGALPHCRRRPTRSLCRSSSSRAPPAHS